MVSTYTPNINLEEPARGDYVGTWDNPVNANMTLLDLVAGGQTTISGAAGSVVLSAAQFQCKTITFNSTLLASITVTFPTSFMIDYNVYNACTGSSAFTITLQTTLAGGGYVCPPPGEIVEVVNIAGQIRFKNLGRVGTYLDIAGSSVPNWISGSNPQPYLLCDGTTFSSASYPQLATRLGSTTLPDARGRSRFAVDGGTGRLSSAVVGFNPDTIGAAGGAQSVAIGSSNLPAHNHPVSDPGHVHSVTGSANFVASTVFNVTYDSLQERSGSIAGHVLSAATGLTVSNSTYANGAFAILPPAFIGGITLIRAA